MTKHDCHVNTKSYLSCTPRHYVHIISMRVLSAIDNLIGTKIHCYNDLQKLAKPPISSSSSSNSVFLSCLAYHKIVSKNNTMHNPMINTTRCCSNTTRSSTYLKLKHASAKLNCVRHFYFNRLPRLWNSLPCIDIDKSLPVIKKDLHSIFWENFIATFNPVIPCTFTMYAHVLNACSYL